MITAPKTGTCYCGCGQPTQGHWVQGHDRQAETWLDKLEGPDTIASASCWLGTARAAVPPAGGTRGRLTG